MPDKGIAKLDASMAVDTTLKILQQRRLKITIFHFPFFMTYSKVRLFLSRVIVLALLLIKYNFKNPRLQITCLYNGKRHKEVDKMISKVSSGSISKMLNTKSFFIGVREGEDQLCKEVCMLNSY